MHHECTTSRLLIYPTKEGLGQAVHFPEPGAILDCYIAGFQDLQRYYPYQTTFTLSEYASEKCLEEPNIL